DIEQEDFGSLLQRLPSHAFVYIDPPYYLQGNALYKHGMSEKDHERLAELLRKLRFRWVLSYDDHTRIRELYSWTAINYFEMTPSTGNNLDEVKPEVKRRRKSHEVVILSPNLYEGEHDRLLA